jgi:hypothetical protein
MMMGSPRRPSRLEAVAAAGRAAASRSLPGAWVNAVSNADWQMGGEPLDGLPAADIATS